SRVPFGELDRLWRRSSGNVLATLLAAGAYVVVIALLGGAVGPLALGATLAAAVLFGPVRAKLQGMVDERFARDRARARRLLREATRRLSVEIELAEKRRREIGRLKDRLEEENRALIGELATRRGATPVIGKGLSDTFELVRKVAKSDATALIRGETGVGKEL